MTLLKECRSLFPGQSITTPVYIRTRGLKSYIIPRNKLGHKYLKSQLVVAILNFSKITCTFPDGGWCDCTMWKITDFNFLVFAPTKNMRFIHGGHFEFQWNFKKSLPHLHIVGNVIVKFEYFLTLSFGVFCPQKTFLAILNFGSIFKKSLAHPYVARNVMLELKKKLTKQMFLSFRAPPKKLK